MEAVGDACEQEGQLEAAREVYLAAPNPCAALRIINRQLSDLIKPAISDQAASTISLSWQSLPFTAFHGGPYSFQPTSTTARTRTVHEEYASAATCACWT